jgi:sulfur-oxidizing protein SoxY
MNTDPKHQLAQPPSRARRTVLKFAAGAGAMVCVRPLLAAPDGLTTAVNRFAEGAKVQTGRVTIDVAPVVENGNSVNIGVTVESPMTAQDHVTTLAIFNEKNPQREVATFQFSPRAGRAQVSTRIRLASTQRLVAVARMRDGSVWSQSAEVIVTLAACGEEI